MITALVASELKMFVFVCLSLEALNKDEHRVETCHSEIITTWSFANRSLVHLLQMKLADPSIMVTKSKHELFYIFYIFSSPKSSAWMPS